MVIWSDQKFSSIEGPSDSRRTIDKGCFSQLNSYSRSTLKYELYTSCTNPVLTFLLLLNEVGIFSNF
jgi:hypothetical protein